MALEVLVTRALGGVTVDVESNVAPPVRVYDSRDTSPSLLDAIGVKSRFVVRRGDGSVLAEYGEPVRPDYVLATLLVTLGVTGLVLLGAAVSRFLK